MATTGRRCRVGLPCVHGAVRRSARIASPGNPGVAAMTLANLLDHDLESLAAFC